MAGRQFGRTVLGLVLFAALSLVGCSRSPSLVEVSVVVDFGPAGQPEVQKTVALPERSTVFEALRAAFQVATSGR